MKSTNHLYCLLLCLLPLLNLLPTQANGQDISGKWKQTETSATLHFAPEGVLKRSVVGVEDNYGIYYIEENLIVLVFLSDGEETNLYYLNKPTSKQLILDPVAEGEKLVMEYRGKHEIDREYVDYLKQVFEDVQAAQQEESEETELETSSNQQPDNLALVGCWEDEAGIGDPFVFDEDGFFKHGSADPAYNYGYVGIYNFDGRTVTMHVYEGGGLTMTVGEVYSFPIENLTARSMNIDKGGGYKPRYRKSNVLRITQEDKDKIQATVNVQKLTNTKWRADGVDYLFLDPDYLIVRQNGRSEARQWLFKGNTLWSKEISGRDDDYSKIGVITSWTANAIDLNSNGDPKQLIAGIAVPDLNASEKTAYIQYLRLNQALIFQTLIGIGQGMDYYEVEWKY